MSLKPRKLVPSAHLGAVTLCFLSLLSGASSAQESHAAHFVRNEGQWTEELLFAAPMRSGFVVITPDAIVIQVVEHVGRQSTSGRNMVIRLPASTTTEQWRLSEPLVHPIHFLRGDQTEQWRRNVATGRVLTLQDLGISVSATATEVRIGWSVGETSVHPFDVVCWDDSLAKRFRLEQGAGSLTVAIIDSSTAAESSNEEMNGSTPPVAAGLLWSAAIEASGVVIPNAIVRHPDGRVTIAGTTNAPNLPVTPGAWDETFAGGTGTVPSDAFVARLAADGTRLEFATYLGGNNNDYPMRMLCLEDDSVVIAGTAFSKQFPTTPGAFMMEAPLADGFLLRLAHDGASLHFSTLIGGSDDDFVASMDRMPDGSFVITGYSYSGDYPVTDDAFDTVGGMSPNSPDGYISRLSDDGAALLFSSYLGAPGFAGDALGAVATLDASRVVVTGNVSAGAPIPTPGSFIAIVDVENGSIGEVLPLGGLDVFFGGVNRFAVAPDGAILAGGMLHGQAPFASLESFDPTWNGGDDGFLMRLRPDLSAIDWFTYYGAGVKDVVEDVAVDVCGHVTVTGTSAFDLLPTTPGAFKQTPGGGSFIARFHRDGTRLLYGSLVGDVSYPALFGWACQMTMDDQGDVILTARSNDPNYPLTPGAYGADGGGTPGMAVVTSMNLLPVGVSRLGESTPGCNGALMIGVTAQPRVGAIDVSLYAGGARPDHVGVLLIGLAPAVQPWSFRQTTIWLDAGQLVGALLWHTDSTGYVEQPLRMPTLPSAVGLETWYQALFADDCTSGGAASTPALGLVVQP